MRGAEVRIDDAIVIAEVLRNTRPASLGEIRRRAKNRTTNHIDLSGNQSLLGEYANTDSEVRAFFDKIDEGS